MADTNKARETELRNKVALKDVGDPKRILGLEETVKELLLGSIIGIASGKKVAKGADGVSEVFGLKGDFEAIPADASKPIIRSGVAYLTEGMMEPIFDAFEDEVDADGVVVSRGASAVRFAYDVYVIRATNAAKYSWALRPKITAENNDPLAELRGAVATAPALAAPTTEAKTK